MGDVIKDVEAQTTAPPVVVASTTTTTTTAAPPAATAAAAQAAAAPSKPVEPVKDKSAPQIAGAVFDGLSLMSNRELLGWIALTSGVYMTQIANMYSQGRVGGGQIPKYEVALGSVATFFALIGWLVDMGGKPLDGAGLKAIAVFLFLWWFAGVVVTTFFGTFIYPWGYANGYFAAWFAFGFSTVLAIKTLHPAVDAPKHADGTVNLSFRPLVGLVFASLVVMGAALPPCTQASPWNSPPQANKTCAGVLAYAVALGSAGAFFALVALLGHSKLPAPALQFLAYFLFAWWIAGAGITTFDAPFYYSGNGFFGSYAALAFSYGFLRSTRSA